MSENLTNLSPINGEISLSPQAVVDNASISNCMNKNKESLKVKLSLRRPIDVLVDQGILPPPKSSPLFHEQKLKLERAKTGDFLKHKIQRRPQRDELVQQHILEDTFDLSYYEQERKLKKARLADDLNERLSHRPGPLELIKGNILHTDESFEQAIKEGQITFKKTCEGEIITNPPKRFVFEEESSSDSATSPLQNVNSPLTPTNQQAINTNQILKSTFVVPNNSQIATSQSDQSNIIPTSTPFNTNLSYILTSSVTNACILPTNTSSIVNLNTKCLNVTRSTTNNSIITSSSSKSIDFKNVGPNKNFHSFNNISQKSKKKVKSKNQPKTRIIKFHEYTGPPNVKKLSNSSQTDAETSYELLLKQQQLFLQWQLECQQKFSDMAYQNNKCNKSECPAIDDSAILLENSLVNIEHKKEDNFEPNNLLTNYQFTTKFAPRNNLPNMIPENSQQNLNDSRSVVKTLNLKQFTPIVKTKFENMKVSDLKAELKKRNLPVSGAKQQLIDRLKPFNDLVILTNNSKINRESDITKETNKFLNQEIITNNNELNNNNSNSTSDSNSQKFILKSNNSEKSNIKLNEEFVFLTNGPENSFPTLPIQLKQNAINLDTPTLTIPIANHALNTFIPQYQIVSSTSNENKINLSGLVSQNTIHSQLTANNNIMLNNKLNIINSPQNIISSNLNYNQANVQVDKNSQLTILTGSPLQISSIKNNLSFKIAQPMTNKVVNIQNSGPFFHQFLLYPTMIGTAPDMNSESKQRSNSLPGDTLHQLQRNSSFPFIINNKVSVSKNSTNSDTNKSLINDLKISMPFNNQKARDYQQNIENDKVLTINNDNTGAFADSIKTSITASSDSYNNKPSPVINNEPKPKFANKKSIEEVKIVPLEHVDSTIIKTTNLLVSENMLNDNSSSLEIQPVSTENSSTLDLDFIINFDDLNEDLNDANVGDQNGSKSDHKMVLGEQINSKEDQNDKSKNNCMIDFNDNWFEMTFGNTSFDHMQTNDNAEDSNKLTDTDNCCIDTNLFESINQLFNQNDSITDIKNNNFINNDNNSKTNIFSKHDPVLSNNNISPTVNPSIDNIVSVNQCYYNANQHNHTMVHNNLKFNNSSNLFNVDPFSEYFFEDTDIKNSMDFSMC